MATAVSQQAVGWAWPADVWEFARRHGVEAYLDPLREAALTLFPTATASRAEVHTDPELRDVAWVRIEIDVPLADVPDLLDADRRLAAEFARVVPGPLAHLLGLTLVRVAA